MYLLESWRDSFRLLMPRQAKVMLLVTAKCLSDLFYSAWVYAVVVPLSVSLSFCMAYSKQPAVSVLLLIVSVLATFLTIIMLLLIRPSVMIKHRYYFISYYRHIIYFVVLQIIINLIHYWKPFYWPWWIWFIWAPVSSFWLLFFIDSHATIDSVVRSLMRAFIMFFYNLPVCLVAISLWYLLFAGLTQIPLYLFRHMVINHALFLFLDGAIVGIVLFPLWYVVITNIYVKQLHEQFILYFGRPLS